MSEEKKQPVIIVYEDEDEKPYAELLCKLISEDDDEGGKIVGSKDESLIAGVWTNKQYIDNREDIESEDIFVIFLGQTLSSMIEMLIIQNKFNKCGIVYEWNGKKAVIYIEDRLLKPKEVEELNSLGNKLKEDIETESIQTAKKGNIMARMPKWAKISVGVIGTVATGGLLTTALGIGAAAFGLVTGNKDKKKQFEIQKNIAICQFYLYGINEFIGEQ